MPDVFDELDDLADADDLEGVERAALRALERAGPEDAADLWRYVAWARIETGRMPAGLEAAREAGDALYEAKALFHLWDFEGAQAALERVDAGGDEEEAEAEWYRGLVAEFTGGNPARHFREAARLLPDVFAEPVRLTDREIDAVVRGALAALPRDAAAALEEAAIEVVPLPRRQSDVDPLTLGVYQGVSALERSVHDGPAMPPRIQIYRNNVERIARDREEAIDELRITFLHEAGHHLGYDERGLERLDLG
ncbi:MAG: metallopeptidase family protein [Planctomycetota bacterium]